MTNQNKLNNNSQREKSHFHIRHD